MVVVVIEIAWFMYLLIMIPPCSSGTIETSYLCASCSPLVMCRACNCGLPLGSSSESELDRGREKAVMVV